MDKVALVLSLIGLAFGLYHVLKREKPVDPPADYNKNSKQPDKNPKPPEV
jgi:hypothetical protein